MKIKKVDDKPMVIHAKKKAKLHTHEPKKLPTSIRLTEVRRLKDRKLKLLKTRSFGGVRFIRLIMQRRECSGSTGQR
ncbi:MAG: hypothetical protein IJ078_01535 [Succinivibrionaceae bacterium]|nr:hypothetical protein [Succinivibrionaceae bacterium]